MKKAILLVAAAIALTACGTHKKAESGASKTTVPVSVKTQTVSKAQKHTAEYIQQRIAAIYRCYDNPQYDEAGMRLMAPRLDEFARRHRLHLQDRKGQQPYRLNGSRQGE